MCLSCEIQIYSTYKEIKLSSQQALEAIMVGEEEDLSSA
jgi:hypothetical protein